jgi:type IV secretion system protein VirB10
MIGILAFGGGPAKPRTTAPSPVAAALDPNPQRIEAYQQRIQEQAARLTQEQADLARAKSAVSGIAEPTGSGPIRTGEAVTATAALRQERAQRDYRSLFADNVAFSRVGGRGDGQTVGTPTQGETSASTGVALPAASGLTGGAPVGSVTYRLSEGTIVETVLTNRLDGTFDSPVNCLVTTAVYAPDQQHLLIPAGARVLGDARPVNAFGQSRLAVSFHRLLLPNGTRIDLHNFHGLNQVGDAGLHDQVDRHYAQIFGASLAIGAIAGLAQAQTTSGIDATTGDVYRQGAAASMGQSSARILDRFLNILPTVTIREGHRVKVYLSNDLDLPAYGDLLPTGGRP